MFDLAEILLAQDRVDLRSLDHANLAALLDARRQHGADALADVIVYERGDHRGAQPKGVGETARHIGFAAALKDAQVARLRHRHVTRIQPQHHFADTY